jgi:hypothetical protein
MSSNKPLEYDTLGPLWTVAHLSVNPNDLIGEIVGSRLAASLFLLISVLANVISGLLVTHYTMKKKRRDRI